MDNPAAWHPDPTGRHEHRWWDGEQWTEHVADAGRSSVDPLEGSGSTSTDDTSDHGPAVDGATGPSSEPSTGSQPAADAWQQPDAQQQPGDQGGWGQPAGGQPGAQGGSTAGADQPQAGWPQQQGWPQSAPVDQGPTGKTPGTAITALILGIVGIVLFCIPIIGAPLAVLAVVLGFIGRSQASKRGTSGGGLGLAGIITGGIGLVINVLMLYFIFVVIGGVGAFFDYADCVSETNDMEYCEDQLERRLGVR